MGLTPLLQKDLCRWSANLEHTILHNRIKHFRRPENCKYMPFTWYVSAPCMDWYNIHPECEELQLQ